MIEIFKKNHIDERKRLPQTASCILIRFLNICASFKLFFNKEKNSSFHFIILKINLYVGIVKIFNVASKELKSY